MFSFFRNKSRPERLDLSALKTDMHSHLVPGIDDGAPDIETSILLIKGMEDLGFKKCITTPHIMWDIFPNTDQVIQSGFLNLVNELKQRKIEIRLKPAAEYFLDDHFDHLLEKDTPLLTISNNLVLVEFSFVSAPINLKEKLFAMQIKGYQPVLAHPERYGYLVTNKGMFDELKSAGCLFQVNLLSFTGYYGKVCTDLANWLASKKYIDLLGTDMHHQRHLDSLSNAGGIMTTVQKLLDTGRILNPSL